MESLKTVANSNIYNGHSGVYCLKNTINGKRYIGSSECLGLRLKIHFSKLIAGSHHVNLMQYDFDLYGEDCFSANVLYSDQNDWTYNRDLLSIENRYVHELNPEYNRQIKNKYRVVSGGLSEYSLNALDHPYARRWLALKYNVTESAIKQRLRKNSAELVSTSVIDFLQLELGVPTIKLMQE